MAFKVLVSFDIEASCYAAALDKVYTWRNNVKQLLDPPPPGEARLIFLVDELLPEDTVKVNIETNFEHDNQGQRVLYLPNEDKETNVKG